MADLITVVDVKKYLFPGETHTEWDTILATLVSAVSNMVIKEIGCDVLHAHYAAEKVSGSGHSWLDLKNWPITAVTTVTDVDSNTYTAGVDNDYTVEDFCLRASGGVWKKGFENFLVTYQAGYAETHSISAFANYGGTIPGTVKATSGAHGMAAGTTADVVITGTTNYNGTYTVTYIDADNFYFTATWVATETGYWSKPGLPADITLVCYELVAQKWKTMRGQAWGETSRNYPDGSSSSVNNEGGFTKAQLAILSKYKRPRL